MKNQLPKDKCKLTINSYLSLLECGKSKKFKKKKKQKNVNISSHYF